MYIAHSLETMPSTQYYYYNIGTMDSPPFNEKDNEVFLAS